MKKLILGLVLATLTLPAIALTDAQKVKVANALSVLSANGIDPTILSTEIDWTQDKFQSAQADTFGNTIKAGFSSTGEFILHQGSAGFENLDNTVDKYGYTHNGVKFGKHRFTTVNLNGTIWMEGGGGSGNAEIVEGLFEDTYERYSTNLVAWEQTWGEGNIFLEDSDVISDFIQGKIGGAVKDKLVSTKSMIHDIAYQTAAAEVGKTTRTLCSNQGTIVTVDPACTKVGEKFLSISNKLINTAGVSDEAHIERYGLRWEINPTLMDEMAQKIIDGTCNNGCWDTTNNPVYSKLNSQGNLISGSSSSEIYLLSNGGSLYGSVSDASVYNDTLDDVLDIIDSFSELEYILGLENSDITYGEVYR